MRLDYPTNIKVIKVPCSGRVDSLTLLKAIESGVDGVCVIGCMEGECQAIAGRSRIGSRAGANVQCERSRRAGFRRNCSRHDREDPGIGTQPFKEWDKMSQLLGIDSRDDGIIGAG